MWTSTDPWRTEHTMKSVNDVQLEMTSHPDTSETTVWQCHRDQTDAAEGATVNHSQHRDQTDAAEGATVNHSQQCQMQYWQMRQTCWRLTFTGSEQQVIVHLCNSRLCVVHRLSLCHCHIKSPLLAKVWIWSCLWTILASNFETTYTFDTGLQFFIWLGSGLSFFNLDKSLLPWIRTGKDQ